MKALIVVDMLNDFINKKGALYCGQTAEDIVPFIKGRIDEYRKNGDAIIYLQDAHDEDDKEFERFPKHAVKGTWGWEIIPELMAEAVPGGGISVVEKKRYSGFFGTYLDEVLDIYVPEEVEVVGVCTSICVMDTVGGLANRDYKITVPRAGVADFDHINHVDALQRMESLYGAEVK